MCKKTADKRKVLIIGGGPASVACAETLRQEGFQGDVTIVTKDKYIPYDRIKLSKVMFKLFSNHQEQLLLVYGTKLLFYFRL